MQEEGSNKRIVNNTVFLYVRMFMILCIGLYTSRVILNTLGVTDFGIYNVVGGLVAMFGFLNSSMTSGTQRFLTFALGKGDEVEVHRVFASSLVVHMLVGLIVFFLAETIGLWFFFNKMIIPSERLSAALVTYQCVIISTLIVIMSVPYNALIIAEEHMSAFAIISTADVILKLLVVLILNYIPYDKLTVYSVLLLITQSFIRICYGAYCKKNFLRKYKFNFDKQVLIKMVKFSSWSMNGNLAIIGVNQGINLLLNMFFGPAVNAARGISVQVQQNIWNFCYNFQLAVSPQITKTYAAKELKRMHELIIFGSKFSYFLLLMVSLPVAYNIEMILNIWLGIVPKYTSEFVIVMLMSGLVRTFANPLITAVHATGNIKRFQLWEGTVLLSVVPIAYLLLRYMNVNPIGVLCVYFIVEIVAQLVRIWIVLPMVEMRYIDYIKQVLTRILFVSFLSLSFVYIIYYSLGNERFLFIAISSLLIIIFTFLICFLGGCTLGERRRIIEYVKRML